MCVHDLDICMKPRVVVSMNAKTHYMYRQEYETKYIRPYVKASLNLHILPSMLALYTCRCQQFLITGPVLLSVSYANRSLSYRNIDSACGVNEL